MKKILAFTLALAMVLATWTPTFAASKEVEALANLKLLLNTTDKEVNADLTRAVGLAMVLKALGYTQEDANAKAKDNTFVDMDKAAWAKGFAVLGEEMKITNGTSVEPKKFSPNWKLNERAFVAFMLRALGYNVDEAWAKAGELAKEAMIAETVSENKLTKGEAAVIMYKALKAKVQGDEKGRTLAEKLVDEKKLDKELAVANELIAAEPENLMVSEATTTNLKEVKVVFNGKVDVETAEKAGNYAIKGLTVESAKAMDNEVVLTVKTSLVNKKEYELTVSGVKNLVGKVMEKTKLNFTATDTMIPEILDVTVTGPKNFVVKFSEPLAKYPVITIKQGNSTLGTAHEGNGEYRVYSNFQEGKEYVLKFGNVKNNNEYATDFAGYNSTYTEHTLTYAKDTAAPEVKLVSADAKKVVVEFTKPVDNVTEKHFAHSYASIVASGIEYDAKTKQHTVTFDKYLTPGEVKVFVFAKADGKVIKDKWGNELANTTLVATIVKDNEAPTVTLVETKSNSTGTEVKVTFSEDLKNEDVKLVIRDEAGKELASLKAKRDDNKKKEVKFTNSVDYSGKTVQLVISEAKDNSVSENKMDEYTETVTFTDKELKPLANAKVEFFKADATKNTTGYLYITFEEEMDDSALDLENYRFDGNYKLKGNAQFLEGNRKVVAIELSADLSSNNDDLTTETDMYKITGKQFSSVSVPDATYEKLTFSSKLKDVAGNVQGEYTPLAQVDVKNLVDGDTFEDKANAAIGFKAVAKATNLVEVEFDAAIKSYDGINLADATSNNTHYVLGAALSTPGHQVVQVTKKSDKVLELLLEKTEGTNAKPLLPTAASTVKLFVKAGVVTDIFGRTTKADGVDLVDHVAPERVNITKANVAHSTDLAIFQNGTVKEDLDNVSDYAGKPRATVVYNQTDNTSFVYIVYSENISGASVSNTIYTVSEGWTVNSAAVVKDKVVKLTIQKANGTVDELKKLTVKQVGAIRDAAQGVLHQDNKDIELLYIEQTGAELGAANETFENGIQ